MTASVGSSEVYNQQMFLAGHTAYYSLFRPGAKTFFVGPSGYTAAAGGIAASDGNDGEAPHRPLATGQQAHTLCVSGRGDTICYLPGTHTLTSPLAITKNNVRVVLLDPTAAVLQGDGVITELLQLDANYILVAGLRLVQATACVRLIDIADTTATTGIRIHHNHLIGGAVASAYGIRNGEDQSGNDALETYIGDNLISNFSAANILTYGGNCEIVRNHIYIRDAGIGVQLGDQGAAFTRLPCFIMHNAFSGATDAGNEVPIDFAGTEANTQLWVAHGNVFAHCASPTTNKHPEGKGANYTGTATATAPTLTQF